MLQGKYGKVKQPIFSDRHCVHALKFKGRTGFAYQGRCGHFVWLRVLTLEFFEYERTVGAAESE